MCAADHFSIVTRSRPDSGRTSPGRAQQDHPEYYAEYNRIHINCSVLPHLQISARCQRGARAVRHCCCQLAHSLAAAVARDVDTGRFGLAALIRVKISKPVQVSQFTEGLVLRDQADRHKEAVAFNSKRFAGLCSLDLKAAQLAVLREEAEDLHACKSPYIGLCKQDFLELLLTGKKVQILKHDDFAALL